MLSLKSRGWLCVSAQTDPVECCSPGAVSSLVVLLCPVGIGSLFGVTATGLLNYLFRTYRLCFLSSLLPFPLCAHFGLCETLKLEVFQLQGCTLSHHKRNLFSVDDIHKMMTLYRYACAIQKFHNHVLK